MKVSRRENCLILFGVFLAVACAARAGDEDCNDNGIPDEREPQGVHNLTTGESFVCIQVAIDAATAGDVLEADPGIYGENIDFLGKPITVQSTYLLTDDSDERRSIIASTVIQGNGDGPVVRFWNDECPSSVIQGFTISGGDVGDACRGFPPHQCHLEAGGGIDCCVSSPTIRDNVIVGNAGESGGGIRACSFAGVIERNVVVANSADMGGGITVRLADIATNDCADEGDAGTDCCSAHCSPGCDTVCGDLDPNVEICVCEVYDFCCDIVWDQSCVEMVEALGCADCSNDNPDCTPTDCCLSHDTSGCDTVCDVPDDRVESCTCALDPFCCECMWDKACVDLAELLCRLDCNPKTNPNCSEPSPTDVVLKDNVIANNEATEFGGGIFLDDSSVTVSNCTITGNSATMDGGGVYAANGSFPSLVNSILWGDSPTEISADASTVVVSYSDVAGGWRGDGNIDADPLFFDPGADDYRLLPCSPAIDAGDPDFEWDGIEQDVFGKPRVIEDEVDMGAHEYCKGDANGDCAVDPLDAGFVLARFGCPVGTGDPNCDMADQNCDGAVDPLDIGFVLARFGPCQ